MQRPPFNRLVACLLLAGALAAGCYAFIGRYDPPFYAGTDAHYFERLVYHSRSQLDESFRCRLTTDSRLRVVGADERLKKEALEAPLLLRFVWFSDVQIRQREVKLFSKRISQDMDDVIPTFEHNFVQEDFDWAVYLSQIEAVNRLHRNGQSLDFMIHTGDGVDAGTIEELYQFIYISNQLQIPWLNIVGNHDISIFGNYQERVGYTRTAGVTFYPVGNLANFVWMHRKEREISGFGRHLLPTPSEGGHSPSEDVRKGKKLPPTFYHGFDLALGQSCSTIPPREPGYDRISGDYAADLCGTEIPLRLIALNSVKTDEWGAGGRITESQRRWLQGVLLPAEKGLNLVFVHHRPEEFDRQTRDLFAGNGALVMFTGHTHQHHLQRHDDPQGRGYYELNTGSVLEYPQIGRLIELRGTATGPVWLISRALWNSLMAVEKLPAPADIDAVLSDCLQQRYAKREIFAEAVRCGHYGAYDDYRDNKQHAWGRPQPFEEGWQAANVVIPVRP